MKIGVISDIHGALAALNQALELIKKQGCDRVVCAGDLVDGEPYHDYVATRLMTEGISTVSGNHDRWVLEAAGLRRSSRRRHDLRRDEAPQLDQKVAFTLNMQKLEDFTLKFLLDLPESLLFETDGLLVAVTHASPGSDMRGIEAKYTSPAMAQLLLDRVGASVLLVGHTHIPMGIRSSGGGLVGNPGSVYKPDGSECESGIGRPYSGTYGVLDTKKRSWEVRKISDDEVMFSVRF